MVKLFDSFFFFSQKEIKVIQLAGHVMELCAYHHGEQSLHATTIALAQDFVGSNNINLLHPGGSFGSRIQVGTVFFLLLPPFLRCSLGWPRCSIA